MSDAPSTTLPKPVLVGPYRWSDGEVGAEYDIGPYQVAIRRSSWLGALPPQGGNHMMLQICREDGGSVFDWRHMQQIKNAICGDEWEAVELFPAESRLADPSNARYLWACSRPFAFGFRGRVVLDADEAIAPQRAFEQQGGPRE